MEQLLILVDDQDREIGTETKSIIHQQGLLHRAFSIFLFNQQGEMLLQKRADSKYHSAGLWTNACCSHPNVRENLDAAAQRRLKEELGISTPLKELFTFTYRAEFGNGMIEHEFDHVFVGNYTGDLLVNPTEISDWRYVNMRSLQRSVNESPEQFTIWFRLAFPRILQWWEQNRT